MSLTRTAYAAADPPHNIEVGRYYYASNRYSCAVRLQHGNYGAAYGQTKRDLVGPWQSPSGPFPPYGTKFAWGIYYNWSRAPFAGAYCRQVSMQVVYVYNGSFGQSTQLTQDGTSWVFRQGPSGSSIVSSINCHYPDSGFADGAACHTNPGL